MRQDADLDASVSRVQSVFGRNQELEGFTAPSLQ